MKKKVLNDYEQLSKVTAEFIITYVNKKPNSLLCLAGGHTPLRTYELIVEAYQNKEVNFDQCKFVGLDEWIGLGKDVKGSCQETLYNELFLPLSISEEQICFFDGLSIDLDEECSRVDSFVKKYGPIDLVLLGVGLNGHLGFNEPGVDIDLNSHVVELDPVTKKVSAKYFEDDVDVLQGITLGINHLMEANTVLLMSNGFKKAEIIKESIEGNVTVDVPSSLLQKHQNFYLFLDKEAASKLN